MDARLQQYDDKMKKAIEFLEADYAGVRAGRANPHVLDKLRVNYYGTPTPIQQVGDRDLLMLNSAVSVAVTVAEACKSVVRPFPDTVAVFLMTEPLA